MAGKIRDISAEKPARRRTFERAIDELAQFPGVVGVAWGQPQRQSRWLDRPSLVVHVRWKHEPRSASERIPRSLDGFETDVIEVTPAVTVSGFFDHSDDVVAPAGTASRTSTPTLLQIAGSKPVALVSAHATLPVIGRTFGSAEGAPVRLSDPKFGHADGVLASGACGRGLDFALAVFDGVDPALWASWHYAGGMPPVARRRTRLVYGESLYLYSNLTGRRCLLRGVYRQDLLHDVELEDPHVGPVNLGALLFVELFEIDLRIVRTLTNDTRCTETSSGFYSADGTNWSVATIARTTTARPSRSSDDVCGERLDAERFCARELRRQGACFAETRTGDLQLVRTSPEDHIIRANTSFTVVACIESNHTLRGELSGTAGLTDPAIDDQRAGRTSSGGDSGVSRAASPRYRRVWLRFPPRQPGPPVDLVVRLRDANNAQIDEVETEFVVEQTYAGALRLGIGVPLFAVQREYTAELVPGSAQREIVASGSDADVELVITFAGFLEALYGGRSYTRPHWNAFEHWGLFVAAGVLSPRPQGVDFLTSIYLGVELELVRSLSLGVGFVLRRVNRLIAGYDVGDAVEAGTKLAAESWEPGLGFVIGVSPDFLQFAGALGGE